MKYNPKKFNIRYNADLMSNNENNNVKIWIVQPSNTNYQKIDKFLISQKPKSSYKDKQNNKILYFNLQNIKKIKIQINIETTLWKNKIILNNKKIFVPKHKRYTKNENFLEQTVQLKKFTNQITKDKKLPLDKIKRIFKFIIKNFEYYYPVKKRGVKNLNIDKLIGDCGEYSSLFVAMCRILKIPARNNTGFVIFPKKNSIKEHGWASINLKSHGWIDMDPQYASLEKDIKTGIKKYFGQRNEYRITFVNGFNIPLKPKIPQNFRIDYWNNLGLPLNHKSIQTLQPIVFSSKNKIQFKEKIEIINN